MCVYAHVCMWYFCVYIHTCATQVLIITCMSSFVMPEVNECITCINILLQSQQLEMYYFLQTVNLDVLAKTI